jgi:uncharacterized protein (TIGR02217 family)
MSFIDEYMSEEVPGYGAISSPRFKTTIQVTFGGNERRNQEWEHPLHQFILPEAVARNTSVINGLKKHWLITKGPLHSFPWRDPMDKASIDHAPNAIDSEIAISMTDQALGTGDGFTDSFQLVKKYVVGSEIYIRTVNHPVLSTVLIADNGVLVSSSDYTVDRDTGIVTFNIPPINTHVLTVGFLFDVEVRFEGDDVFEGIVRTWQAGGFSDLTLIEVRPC